MKKVIFSLILIGNISNAQVFRSNELLYTKQDTLKGSNTDFRNFWNVNKYDIELEANHANKSIIGRNKITFEITKDIVNPVFQIDLQKPMLANNIKANFSTDKNFTQKEDFVFVQANKTFKKGEKHTITVDFSGNPVVAKNAPWDGGWIFTADKNGNPWMTAAVQGIGSSLWLPTKDIWSDEPEDGITFKITTPKDLVGVANGKLVEVKTIGAKKTFLWEVKNPINTYSIIPSIGKYVNFKDEFEGEKGTLDLDYWVLDYNLEKAKSQFKQTGPMMKSFEYWFGPYPFYEDSFKVVEAPHLGMEHQSNVAYGNNFENGYKGRDLSGTGVGLKFDYILIHETGHEWFGNNITAKDVADMWIHEAFTDYSETLYIESLFGKKDASQYVIGLRKSIMNDKPIIGTYGVRQEGSGDMYYKGANLVHTIRQVINDDAKFRSILRGLNKDFYHQTVTTEQIENYFIEKSGINLSSIFDQYLRTIKIPTLAYKQTGKSLAYKWINVNDGFAMPIRLSNGEEITPSDKKWSRIDLADENAVSFDPNYYIYYKELKD